LGRGTDLGDELRRPGEVAILVFLHLSAVFGRDEQAPIGLRLAVGAEDLGVVRLQLGAGRRFLVLVKPAQNFGVRTAMRSFLWGSHVDNSSYQFCTHVLGHRLIARVEGRLIETVAVFQWRKRLLALA